MALTEDEKVRIEYHLCWTSFSQVLNVTGVVVDHQVVTMLRRNMNEAPEKSLPKIRECLCECEKIEGEIKSARKRFGVKEVDGAKFDAREQMDLLDNEYNRWRKHLADCLGGHINLWSLLNEQLGVATGLRENYA